MTRRIRSGVAAAAESQRPDMATVISLHDSRSKEVAPELCLDDPTIVRIPAGKDGCDGFDYQRICVRHQWASLPIASRHLVSDCLYCDTEVYGKKGQDRYSRLHARMAS